MPEYWTSLSKSLAYLVGYIGKLWLGPLSPDLCIISSLLF